MPNGSLDLSFANNGANDFFATLGDGRFQDVQPAAHGGFYAGGVVDNLPVVAKFTADGQLDAAYGGGDGFVVLTGDFSRNAEVDLVETTPDGELLVLADRRPDFADIPAVTRLTAAGAIDTTFGTNGTLSIAVPDAGPFGASGNDLDLLADGSLVISGDDFDRALLIKLAPTDAGPGVTATLSDGVLRITGTDDADDVAVANDFNGSITVTAGGRTEAFPFNAVSRIEADLLGGDDRLEVGRVLFVPVDYNGGEGDDVLDAETSPGDDDDGLITESRIVGGANDVMFFAVETINADFGFGADTILIDVADTFEDQINVLGGVGDDTFNVRRSPLFPDRVRLLGGADDDVFAFEPTARAGPDTDGGGRLRHDPPARHRRQRDRQRRQIVFTANPAAGGATVWWQRCGGHGLRRCRAPRRRHRRRRRPLRPFAACRRASRSTSTWAAATTRWPPRASTSSRSTAA